MDYQILKEEDIKQIEGVLGFKKPVLRLAPTCYVFTVDNSGQPNYSSFTSKKDATEYAERIRRNGFRAFIVSSDKPITIE